MIGYTRITREQYVRDGGASNPRLCRVTRNGEWAYFRRDA